MAQQYQIEDIPRNLPGDDLDELLGLLPAQLRAHSQRVGVYSSLMAEYTRSFLSYDEIPDAATLATIAHTGGSCHDIGKLLTYPYAKDKDDYLRHPLVGARFLEQHADTLFESKVQARMVVDMVRYHHERPGGDGFFEGLQANDTPLLAGICNIANALDHYLIQEDESGNIPTRAFEFISRQAGSAFSEQAVLCFAQAWSHLNEQYGF